jgi:hypothetical protein
MEQHNRIQQLYGYVVCLIAVIVFLIASLNIVNAIFDRIRPVTMQQYGPYLDTFEAYQMQQRQLAPNGPAQKEGAVETPPDSELRKGYESWHREQQAYASWQATKSIVTNSIMLIIAAALFLSHWRWIRRLTLNANNG